MNPTRRWFVKAFSGAILTTLLGVKAWRLEDAEWEVDAGWPEMSDGDTLAFEGLQPDTVYQWRLTRDGITVYSGEGRVDGSDGGPMVRIIDRR